ncbi:hypothetical protein VKT23_011777 [Stygiomarasmius scandens]|uniref:Mid2 domain-containing protein n=1 Tax=Marasmiellus scandens TaxID=2682957 RepID=A0ABR1JAN3_9AGAR
MWLSALFYMLLGWIPRSIISICAIHNVTVNNTDPNIAYSAHDWSFATYKSGASDHWSDFEGAKAVYNFTGVAIFYSVHLYSNHGIAGAHLSLDGSSGDDVQLFDPNSTHHGENPVVVWSKTNLENKNHSLTAQISRDVELISLDTLIVTVLDPGDPGSATTETSTVTSSNPTSSDIHSDGSKKRTIGIAVGTVLGLVAVGALVGCLFLYRKQQLRPTTPQNAGDTAPPSDGMEAREIIPIPNFIGHKPLDSFSSQNTIGYNFLPEVHAPSTASLAPTVQVNSKASNNRSKQLPGLPRSSASFNAYNPQTFNPNIEAYPTRVNWAELGSYSDASLIGTQDGERGRHSITTILTPPPNYVSGPNSMEGQRFE